jgi:hypothetical protein
VYVPVKRKQYPIVIILKVIAAPAVFDAYPVYHVDIRGYILPEQFVLDSERNCFA